MTIWIDGDACPKSIKDILFRAAIRTKNELIIVANQNLAIPGSPFIKKYLVKAGFDAADNYIVTQLKPNDLVITADIPLADAVITQGGFALNPRGDIYTKNNIKQLLTLRNFNESLRSAHYLTAGPAKLSQREIQLFANRLDYFLVKHQLP